MTDEATARAKIEAGMCPICDRGPFVVVASHTNKAHDVNKRTLRDLAGMKIADSTSSAEFSARQSDLFAARMDFMFSRRFLAPCGTHRSYRRGCRCDECRGGHAAYARAERRRVKSNLEEAVQL